MITLTSIYALLLGFVGGFIGSLTTMMITKRIRQTRAGEQRNAPADPGGAPDEHCKNCSRYLEPAWHYCPECGTPRLGG